MKHTKGPWRVFSKFKTGAIDVISANSEICLCRSAEADNEANARLIAAAPEMYDALVRIIDAFGINPFMKARRDMSAEELNGLIKLAVEAVRKADGE